MLQEEALIIAARLEIEDFAASNGCLESFKKNHNITTVSVAGEAGDITRSDKSSCHEKLLGNDAF